MYQSCMKLFSTVRYIQRIIYWKRTTENKLDNVKKEWDRKLNTALVSILVYFFLLVRVLEFYGHSRSCLVITGFCIGSIQRKIGDGSSFKKSANDHFCLRFHQNQILDVSQLFNNSTRNCTLIIVNFKILDIIYFFHVYLYIHNM